MSVTDEPATVARIDPIVLLAKAWATHRTASVIWQRSGPRLVTSGVERPLTTRQDRWAAAPRLAVEYLAVVDGGTAEPIDDLVPGTQTLFAVRFAPCG